MFLLQFCKHVLIETNKTSMRIFPEVGTNVALSRAGRGCCFGHVLGAFFGGGACFGFMVSAQVM